ncbi:MAG TPA: sulfite exporter TauE/SafE family protein, partial [Methylomirabilota bacterium]|nr:sulfite exporter TauE/SafE family protein [Methylomirabilota bacterium]
MGNNVALITLAAVTLLAAVVNGGLGYGFSSITVPVALVFYVNRMLNPALVLVEVVLNGYLLFINRKSVPRVWKRVIPILAGLFVGVGAGSHLLSLANPEWLKFFTYASLLPLILLQAAGVRRPIGAERMIGVPFGAGVGVLYSLTTISGPPLALLFNNQGYEREEFRAALGIIRVAESSLTAIAYYWLSLYSSGSAQILLSILPSVVIGVPVGAYLVRRTPVETFRRICMSFDAWVVGFGLSRVLVALELLASPAAYGVWFLVAILDAYLLYLFFNQRPAF